MQNKSDTSVWIRVGNEWKRLNTVESVEIKVSYTHLYSEMAMKFRKLDITKMKFPEYKN